MKTKFLTIWRNQLHRKQKKKTQLQLSDSLMYLPFHENKNRYFFVRTVTLAWAAKMVLNVGL